MSIVAEFMIPPKALPAGDALVENPDIRIEIERIVPTQESALPFFWVWGPRPETFMEEAGRDPNMAEVNSLDHVKDGALFRAEWTPDAELIHDIKQSNATIIDATGTSDCWRFEVRTQEQNALKNFQAVFDQHGIRVLVKADGRGYIYDRDDSLRSTAEPRQVEAPKRAD